MPIPRRYPLDRCNARAAPPATILRRGHRLLTRKSAFAPVAGPETRVLILGSLPGEASLAANRYYAHPQNRFWHLVGEATAVDLPHMPYDERLDALRSAGVGLWDVVASARRNGSLDSAIRGADHAPLVAFAATLPNLKAVAFNGRKSATIGRPQLGGQGYELIDLPSSSPAYAAMPYTEKARLWRRLAEFLR